ncbi:uncharacterized protein LOC108087034 isoform X5 [Drosophila ficusphila]|uniref:uncharacterized protein LOC108087034 isoform X5 n=1 Tax=Drosophila ficusphila TaxID=30025 RepID=UPI0007E5D499|nr:uncharacterized protein LOC108087034 isoform X5 [Drosophila ficusphila]
MGRIFGGDFGSIEPGKSETISLVWPTVSLFNRVGFCPILISATSAHAQDAVATARQVLHFDTRFETLDPQNNKLRRRKDFMDCRNWDKDYLRNCTPLNCEERYFGQRSFFNEETEQCEKVSECSGRGEFYDIFSNEAISGNFVTEEELDLIKQGKFDLNFLDLKRPLPHLKDSQFPENLEDGKKVEKKSPFEVPVLTQLYYDWYLPLRADNWAESVEMGAESESIPQNASSGSVPLLNWVIQLDSRGWLLLILKGSVTILLLIVFQILATLTAYFLICLAVYGFMELYSVFTSNEAADNLIRDSSSQHSVYDLFTSESLMSQR